MVPLKEATADKHKKAERMPFNVRMFKGLLDKDEYLLYLNQQLNIFQAIERKGLPHISLERSKSVQADIKELNSEGHYSDSLLNSTNAYLDYIK